MLKRLLYLIANSLLVIACLRRFISFKRSISHVETVQKRTLFGILKQNAKTKFGNEHNFASITSINDFRANVPLSTYDSYIPYIKSICEGKSNILTNEPVLLLEPSSGSTAPSKYIPYTKGLKEDFQKGISPWIFSLFARHKRLLLGNAYWSITPVSQKQSVTEGGIPIGFEEESEYFGRWKQRLQSSLFAVPKEVCRIKDMETFRYVTLLFLLKDKFLALISVWNPTFLTLLLAHIERWMNSLVNDIQNSTISQDIEPLLKKILIKKLSWDTQRAAELRKIFRGWENCPGTIPSLYEAIWPNLVLISCWVDGNASHYIENLKMLFPNTEIQGKGLIATEGFVSFPLSHEVGTPISIESHFFEFIENGEDSENTKLAYELKKGKYYSVVITTSGGFYRYKLHDIVKVLGFRKQCPLIRFVGKEDKIADLFGEKLNESFIHSVLIELFKKYPISPSFLMVAPDKANNKYFYTLFIELIQSYPRQRLKRLAYGLEEKLKQNYHYKYCRQLKQLDKLKIFIIVKDGLETYLRVCQSLGQRVGDIKPVILHSKIGWAKEFHGYFL